MHTYIDTYVFGKIHTHKGNCTTLIHSVHTCGVYVLKYVFAGGRKRAGGRAAGQRPRGLVGPGGGRGACAASPLLPEDCSRRCALFSSPEPPEASPVVVVLVCCCGRRLLRHQAPGGALAFWASFDALISEFERDREEGGGGGGSRGDGVDEDPGESGEVRRRRRRRASNCSKLVLIKTREE